MSNIRILDEKTAGKIAAGEVIERPAGVLKELLENAVDAGASCINITIEGSGKDLIRINDNGCGMNEEDLALSVLRHATSKIGSFGDLEHLNTFGFRGEALYSVAAVSRMALTSCTGEGPGNRLEIHAGKVVSKSPAPSIKGTTVEIRDLFFNTPARLKFLKSDSYERACLLKVIEESALANLQVSYRVTVNGRDVYDLPAQTGSLPQAAVQRAKDILGEEVAQCLLYKEFEEMGLRILLTPADKLVNVRDMQYVFVNRRPIDSKIVQQAIYKAYQNVRPKDRHPAFVAYMTLPPADFDVNIHPQKRDIRFVNENRVFGFIMHAAGETVFQNTQPIEVSVESPAVSLPAAAQPAAEQLFTRAPSPITQTQTSSFLEQAFPAQTDFPHNTGYLLRETEEPVDYTAKPLTVPAKEEIVKEESQAFVLPVEGEPSWYQGPYHYLGQLQRSYLLFENPQGLVLIDQHAAQERVLFEHYLDEFERHSVKVQKLLFPIRVDLPPSNLETLLSWSDFLKTAGFEIEPFSARTVQVHTLPYMIRFKEDDMKEFIISLAQVVGDPTKSTETLKRKMVAMLACKKAIKAHDQISAAEAETLLEDMKKCKDGMHCPHGRPCVAQLKMKEVEKLFGR
ncbi:MAG: DNA mismatch repair endonuclease MutL [Elusimicrobium sp.]|uniref:DNA mismatch repair protein MutL n=1 Tax=Candidatus Avelusimicrobium gallicola TaxID=2562704 RepID=A0A928DPP6_9BACT|nr:DNA mismatch repair endonuclease MutL [Elusimicrobium sp.]